MAFHFLKLYFLSITVYFLNFDIITALIINLTSNIIFSILGILFIRKWITFTFEKFYKKELILFAIPIGLACIIESFMPVIERQLILKYLSLHNLGIYAATKIAMIISLLIGAFQICWDPMALSIFKEKNASKHIIKYPKYFVF